jgi:hypothetical protein
MLRNKGLLFVFLHVSWDLFGVKPDAFSMAGDGSPVGMGTIIEKC